MSTSNEARFAVPIGDEMVFQGEAEVWMSNELAAWAVGGRTQWARGRLHLTRTVLAFRELSDVGDHRQDLTVPLGGVSSSAVAQHWLGFLKKRPSLLVSVELSSKPFELGIRVDEPAEWVRHLQHLQARSVTPIPAAQALDAALAEGVRDRARYVSTLESLRLPVMWGVSHEELLDALRVTMTELGVSLPEAFFASVAIPPDLVAACEDYEMDLWGEETAKVAELANEHIPEDEPRRFYRFASDVPGWDREHPVLLLLTDAQRRRLVALDVLHAAAG